MIIINNNNKIKQNKIFYFTVNSNFYNLNNKLIFCIVILNISSAVLRLFCEITNTIIMINIISATIIIHFL